MNYTLLIITTICLFSLVGCTTPIAVPDVQLECPVCVCDKPTVIDDSLFVYFINVGQGDAALIKYHDTEMLIDCGKNTMGTTVVDFLKEKGVTELEYLLITHPASDHLGGCEVVMDEFNTKTIIMNHDKSDTISYTEVMNNIDTEQLIIADVMDTWQIGSAFMQVVQAEESLDDNGNSLVTQLSYLNYSVLFTGDCDNECDDRLANKNIQANILKVGHHGSKFATGVRILNSVKPIYAVISVGDNQYGHPTDETLDRLSQNGIITYRTDRDGNIGFKFNDKGYEVVE